jgi:hypothetical protein
MLHTAESTTCVSCSLLHLKQMGSSTCLPNMHQLSATSSSELLSVTSHMYDTHQLVHASLNLVYKPDQCSSAVDSSLCSYRMHVTSVKLLK